MQAISFTLLKLLFMHAAAERLQLAEEGGPPKLLVTRTARRMGTRRGY